MVRPLYASSPSRASAQRSGSPPSTTTKVYQTPSSHLLGDATLVSCASRIRLTSQLSRGNFMTASATARNSFAGLTATLALLVGGMIAMTQSHTEAGFQAGTSGKPAAHVKADGRAEIRPFRVHF